MPTRPAASSDDPNLRTRARSSSSNARNAREAACYALERIEEDAAYIGLSGEIDADGLDDRERRQAKEYVAGVTRHRRWLDFLLAKLYRGEYDTIESRVRQILRIGAYDLLMLSTPSHAAVHENVKLAKRVVRPGAGRLVNAILRTLDRDRERAPDPKTGNPAEDLAIRHSHPTWLVERWLARFGHEETVDLLEWNNRRPAYGVRVNTARHPVETVRAWLREREVVHAPSPFLDDFLRLVRLQALVQSDLLDDGACAVQDEGAGLVVRLLDPQPGETVIDGCAAPGGKALYAATRMKAAAAEQGQDVTDAGRVLAYDVHASRLRLLSKAAPAHGFAGLIQTEAADLKDVAARDDAPQADRVLLDAPCSGLGVLAKRADLRWQRTPDEIDDLVALQDGLLDAAAALVKPGGLLVYATCTLVPEENEERVLAFCARHPDFSVEPATGFVPDECVTDDGFYTTLPHRHGIDGAFGVRLRRAA